MMFDPRNKLIAIGIVSEALGLSRDAVRKLDEAGVLPAARTAGQQRRWKYCDVLAYYNKMNNIEEKQ